MSAKKKNVGAIVSGIVALLALAGLTMAFLSSASPYVTLAEAKTIQGDSLHLAGDMVKGSMRSDLAQSSIRFTIKDSNGEQVNVVYEGAPPSNLSEATRVVAIGKLSGSDFMAHNLLVKCPSKYEGEKKA